MKKMLCYLCFFSITLFAADDASFIPENAVLHPLIKDCFKENPILLKGGYYLKHIDDDHYILVGVGKGSLEKGFPKAFRLAKINAEIELSKILNAMEVDVKTVRTIDSVSTDEETIRSQHYKKSTKLLLQSQTVNIQSAGFWFEGKYFCYVQAVFAGDFSKVSLPSDKWVDQISDFTVAADQNTAWRDILAKYPWLQYGGSAAVVGPDGKKYLFVVPFCKDTLPLDKTGTAFRVGAEPYVTSFSKGNKLSFSLRRIREHWKNNSESGSDSWKKKNAELKTKTDDSGMMAEERPAVTWKQPEQGILLGLLIYQIN